VTSRGRVGLIAANRRRTVVVTDYPTEVLADSPSLYWRFEETSGLVLDSSGNGRDGTIDGTITRGVAGARGTGITVVGLSANVSIASFAAATVTPFSYEFWVRPVTAPGYDIFVMKSTDANWNNGYGAYWLSPNIEFYVGNYASGPLVRFAPTLNAWCHVVYTYDGTTANAYRNGALAHSASGAPGGTISTAAPLSLAGQPTFNTSLNTDFDEFAFYPVALSAPRVAAHYNGS
jgi:Concanavalin A-like lectin/glucanases superfamily